MSTDNIYARKEEKDKINVHDANELRYWSTKFGVRKERVIEAVIAVGNTANEVDRYLRGS